MRRTRIIATLGPASRSRAALRALFDAGCDVVRINMSHTEIAEATALIADVRAVSDGVGILIDTRGPEIRTTSVEGRVELATGAEVEVRGEPGPTTAQIVRVSYADIAAAVDVGARVLIDDGRVELEVLATANDGLRCRVVRGGRVCSRKGVNLPIIRRPMPFMSPRDAADIRFAAQAGADFIAASFVSHPDDVAAVRALVEAENAHTAIIAKIESRRGLDHLDRIIATADGIMVARGDLGVEIPAEEVPLEQMRMIAACRKAGQTVIVATEMLESMIHARRPTRAETTDVANAIFEGTDATMLSGETAVGEHPAEAVATMARIAAYAEARIEAERMRPPPGGPATDVADLVCRAAWQAARELDVAAIVVPTRSGATAKRVSRLRPPAPILTTTPDLPTARRLALSYGVVARPLADDDADPGMEARVRRSCRLFVEEGLLAPDDRIAVVGGVPALEPGTTNQLTVQRVGVLAGLP